MAYVEDSPSHETCQRDDRAGLIFGAVRMVLSSGMECCDCVDRINDIE